MTYDYDPCLTAAALSACAAPVRTTVKTRLTAGQPATHDVHTFADGLRLDNRTITVPGSKGTGKRPFVLHRLPLAPTRGRLTAEAEWLNPAAAPNDWLTTALEYDAYGNVTRVTRKNGVRSCNLTF